MPSFRHPPALGRFLSFVSAHPSASGTADPVTSGLELPPARARDPQWVELDALLPEAVRLFSRLAEWRHRAAAELNGSEKLANLARLRLAAGLPIRPLPVSSGSTQRETLIATPEANDALAWARFCKQEDVGQVVDLGTSDEARRINHCMRSTAPSVLSGGTVAFRPQADHSEGAGFFADQMLPAIDRQASARPVHVQVLPHPMGRSVGPDLDVIEHNMSWLRIPIGTGQVVAPRVLLETCAHLQQAAQGHGGHAVFMSPDGDRRALVFAIAWRLQQHLRDEAWTPQDMSTLLEKVCCDIDMAGGGHIAHAQDLASLLSFASMTLRAQASASGGAALKG